MIIFGIILLIFVLLILPTLSMYWQDRLDGKNKDKRFINYFYEPPEQKYAKEIADGTVVIIKSKLSKTRRLVFWISFGVLLVLFAFYLFNFLDYLEQLSKTCEQFMGLNPLLFHDLISLIWFPIMFFSAAWTEYRAYQSIRESSGYYPPLSSQSKYQDVICHKIDDSLIGEKQRGAFGNIVTAIICTFLCVIQFHAPISQLFNANTIYNQKCEAKQYPFDRFHKKSE